MRVGWGIMGCGWIGTESVAPAIRASQNGRLVAVASRDPNVAAAKAREVGAERAYAPYEAMLADPEVDAVYIGLPNGLHEEWAIRCAQAGKHVLCEKSLTMTAASARRMAAGFAPRGLRLVEAFMYRHHPQWSVVKNLLDEGAIGKPVTIRASFCSRFDKPADHRWSRGLGGGALWDLTCYAVDVARYISGAEVLEAIALSDSQTREGVDASTFGALKFAGGLLASVTGSLRAGRDQSVAIDGPEGTIEVVRPFLPGLEPTHVVLKRGFFDAHRRYDVEGANQHVHQVEHFASLVSDPTRAAWPAEDGVRNVAACEALEKSWRAGAPVALSGAEPA